MDKILLFRILSCLHLKGECLNFTNNLLLIKNKTLHLTLRIIINNQAKVPLTFIQNYSQENLQKLFFTNQGREVENISSCDNDYAFVRTAPYENLATILFEI